MWESNSTEMKIYRYRTTLSTSGLTGSTNTNPIIGAICHQIYIQAQTATTTFQANIQDVYATTARSYAVHVGKILDDNLRLPVENIYTIQITNASADGPFDVMLLARE